MRCSRPVLVEEAKEGSILGYSEAKTLWMRKRYSNKKISSHRLWMSMKKILTILKGSLIGLMRVMEEAHFYLTKALTVFNMNIIKVRGTPRVILSISTILMPKLKIIIIKKPITTMTRKSSIEIMKAALWAKMRPTMDININMKTSSRTIPEEKRWLRWREEEQNSTRITLRIKVMTMDS